MPPVIPLLNTGQPVVDPQTTFTPEALSTAFQKYRTELIVMPMYAMAQALQHMGYRDGIRYKEHVHEMKGNFQMGNFDKYKKGDGAIEIVQRTLETFLGNCIEPIDPISIYKSLWGSDVTKGEALKTVPWVKRVCAYIMAQLGENMYKVMWTAKHDPTNTTLTSKWFNGFCTIEDAEIEAGAMAVEEGNLYYLPETFTAENTEDLLKDFYWGVAGGWNGANDKLKNQKLKLFMHVKTKHFYEEAYQHNHGALPYNEQYIKAHLDGVPNVEFVGLTNVPENYLCLTPKNNILALWNQRTADETFLVKESKTSHYDVDFLANMFYGQQYLSIKKEMLCVARYDEDEVPADDNNNEPETITVSKSDVTVGFTKAVDNATMGQEYAGQVATTNPAGKTVTYASSDQTVATVNASTGAVTLVGAGTTLITASFAGDDTHNAASGSYALTVAAAAQQGGG